MPLTQDRNTPMKDGDLISFPMAGATKIYAGSLVVANANGFAAPGSAANTLTALGRAEEHVDNTDGANGAKSVNVRRRKAFKYANHGADQVTQADVGKTCYIVDDQTVAKTSDTNARSAAGRVLGVESDGVWVYIA